MGEFDEVERLQAGLREWVLRTARSGRPALRDIPAQAVLPLLCAAAFGPVLGEATGLTSAFAVARIGVLSSVGADVLADVLTSAAGRTRPPAESGEVTGPGRGEIQQEVSRSIGEVLARRDERADGLRSDIAMVLREIDAGGTVFRAAIEAGREEAERDVLAAVEAVSAEFGDMAFLLADLIRAAVEVQDSLAGQGTELRAASEQVGRQSADVRLIREELAVIERRTRHWTPVPGGQEHPGPGWAGGCPYPGLLPYGQAHEAVFFGRERLVAELAGKLAETGIVVVSGGSGAGKTSLLNAGLVPALNRGVQIPGSSAWPVVGMKATARPLTELAQKLAVLAGREPGTIRKTLADAPGEAHLLVAEMMPATAEDQREHLGHEGRDLPTARLVLIIDQFERVFADDGEDGRRERTAFIDAVCAAATKPAGSRAEPPARVVIAVRGDYWDRCAAYPQLVGAMEQAQLVVGPMPEARLRRAIAGAAEAGGLGIDGALADAIVADIRVARREQGTPVLPRLSQAMMATWEKRENGQLTAEGYEGSGRVARAIEVSAEAVYRGLADNQKTIARDVFRQMAAMAHDGRPVGRPASRADLRERRPKHQWPQVDAVLEAFVRSRLVVLNADVAEIAHDVLLQAWPRLRNWLQDDQTTVILHGRLAEDTARWRQNGKDGAVLYRGTELAAARQAARLWAADPDRYAALTPPEADFLRASGRAATRGKRGRRTLAMALAVLVLAALTAAGLAVRSARNTADQQRTTDLSERLAAQSAALEAMDPLTASLLAGAAWRIAPTAQARYSLLESLAQPLRGILAAQSGVVTALAYSPGGHTLAAGYSDGTIRLWDPASHHLVSTSHWGAAVRTLAFTSHGQRLQVAGPGAIGTWNLTSQAKIVRQPLADGTGASGRASGAASAVAFSPDAVAFSPDGKIVATGGQDGNLRLWNAATGQEIGAPMSSGLTEVDAVAFSPDGSTVAAASTDGTVQLWDVATGQEAAATISASSTAVKALMFSPDGKILVAGDQDGNVRLWDVATHTQAGAVMATGAAPAALAFSPGGTTLATAESDGSTELWDVATQHQTGPSLTAQSSGGVSAVAFSPDAGSTGAGWAGAGTTGGLATGNGDGTVQLWNPAGFHQASAPLAIGTLEPLSDTGGYPPAVLSANGGTLAVSGIHGVIRLWNVITGRPVGVPIGVYRAVQGLAVSPDGQTVAVTADGLQLWATATGQRTGNLLPAADAGGPVAFSPDGSLMATIGNDGQARLWDVATQTETGAAMSVGRPAEGQGALAFSPNGKILAAVGANGRASLWQVATQRAIGESTAAGSGAIPGARTPAGLRTAAVAFSPDGTMLATAGGDGTTRLWDVATQAEVGTPMTAGTQPVYALTFNPDGTMLATASGDGSTRLWDVTFPARLLAAACAIADASFTRQQWADYAGTQPFQLVCPAG